MSDTEEAPKQPTEKIFPVSTEVSLPPVTSLKKITQVLKNIYFKVLNLHEEETRNSEKD